MSKLYDKYENLKSTNANSIYLFECGNFYIALDSDAIVMNEMFNLKLTKFSNLCDKCGFPKNALEKYKEQLKPVLDSLSERYRAYAKKFAEHFNCEVDEIEPYVYICITAVANYMIFGEA